MENPVEWNRLMQKMERLVELHERQTAALEKHSDRLDDQMRMNTERHPLVMELEQLAIAREKFDAAWREKHKDVRQKTPWTEFTEVEALAYDILRWKSREFRGDTEEEQVKKAFEMAEAFMLKREVRKEGQ